jgi:hypothetical protein
MKNVILLKHHFNLIRGNIIVYFIKFDKPNRFNKQVEAECLHKSIMGIFIHETLSMRPTKLASKANAAFAHPKAVGVEPLSMNALLVYMLMLIIQGGVFDIMHCFCFYLEAQARAYFYRLRILGDVL